MLEIKNNIAYNYFSIRSKRRLQELLLNLCRLFLVLISLSSLMHTIATSAYFDGFSWDEFCIKSRFLL